VKVVRSMLQCYHAVHHIIADRTGIAHGHAPG
jgi:hypothetical protein